MRYEREAIELKNKVKDLNRQLESGNVANLTYRHIVSEQNETLYAMDEGNKNDKAEIARLKPRSKIKRHNYGNGMLQTKKSCENSLFEVTKSWLSRPLSRICRRI